MGHETASIYLLVTFIVRITLAERWMSIAMLGSAIKNEKTCNNLKGLNTRQIRVCRRNIELMDSVQNGAEMAIKECQHQFRYRKWNCTTINKENEPVFGNALKKGTREAAFVYAIASASVSYSVTRSCTLGNLRSCSCDRSLRGKTREGWYWASCSDNVKFGTSFSRSFLDARVRERRHFSRARILMNLHNNEVGRKILTNNMVRPCKCHGVCGTCNMMTCWRRLPHIRAISKKLKEKFDGASLVKETLTSQGRRILLPRHEDFKPPTSTDLVYLHSSPDFCVPNEDNGSFGTEGRVCKKQSRAIDGCELLCCGRGHKTKTMIVEEKCNCKFNWCCFVQCEKCKKEVHISTCY